MTRTSFVAENGLKYNGRGLSLAEWFGTETGRYVLAWERAQYERATEDVFGYRAAQAGLPGFDFLQANRIPHRFTIALEPGADLAADPLQLPIASDSLDLLALPHTLETHAAPHELLREAARVLRPEGRLVVSGFNSLSLWRLRQAFMREAARRRAGAPWDLRFLGLLRLKDWLQVLGLELDGGRFGCYAPPFARAEWMRRFAFLDRAGDRWWPILGAVYVVRAVKRVPGLRVIAPAWRRERARRRALAPLPQCNGSAPAP